MFGKMYQVKATIPLAESQRNNEKSFSVLLAGLNGTSLIIERKIAAVLISVNK